MSKLIYAAALALACLLGTGPVAAQSSTRDQIHAIEQEYARQNDGRVIPDRQLEFYLDRADAGWGMSRIAQDIEAQSRRRDEWRPESGWTQREVVCTSIESQYRECAAPFNGRAVITQQISRSECVEGQTWGQKPGMIWVNRGCRARFGILPTNVGSPGYVEDRPGSDGRPGYEEERRTLVCQSRKSRYHECRKDFSGRVELISRLPYSASCVKGRSWGQRENLVWVSRGCRAKFAAINRDRDDRGDRGDRDNNYAVTCSSTSGNTVRCSWDDRYGRPRLDEQLSQSACVEGRTWGYSDDRRDALWVDGGCRARFVGTRSGRGDGNNDWGRDPSYHVTCSSDGSRMTRCNWDSRYGSPRLIEKLSQAACVQGSSWGYDSQNGLWVDDGCRARFGAR